MTDMPECKYCGKYESSKWNLAGFVCSDCRLTCPECGKTDKVLSHRLVVYEGQAYKWCHGCAQLLPPALEDLEPPISDEDVRVVLEDYGVTGVTLWDADVIPHPDELRMDQGTDEASAFYERHFEENVALDHVTV